MTDLDRLLAAEFEELGRAAPHDADLAGTVRRRARRRTAAGASALAVLAVLGAAVATARLREPAASGPPASGPAVSGPAVPGPVVSGPVESGPAVSGPAVSGPSAVSAGTACRPLETGPLPDWARTGFSGPDFRIPHARTADGTLLAIPFGALSSPPAPGRSNKILWVLGPQPGPVASGPEPLVVEAGLVGSDLRARRELDGIGPSLMDLPAPGCWRLDLRYGTYTGTLTLRYAPG